MSTTTKERTRAPQRARALVPAQPQVNLLPPEVRQARSLAVVKRWLAIALLVVVAGLGAGYGYAQIARAQAEDELEAADDETAQLRTDEQKYAEVPQVLQQLETAHQALLAASGTEVAWKTYVDALTAVLPGQTSINSFTLNGPEPTAPLESSPNVLTAPTIGSITLDAQTLTVPDVAATLDALASVPGFTDPWASSVAVSEVNEVVYYSVSYTVQLTDATLADRFADTDEPAGEATAAATPAPTEGSN